MTRDEAINKLVRQSSNDQQWAARWIDSFAVLGMLKLDPEPQFSRAAIEALNDAVSTNGIVTTHSICEHLTAAGLTIVKA